MEFLYLSLTRSQGLSQDLETGCPKLATVKFCGVQIFKGDHNILRFHDILIQCHGNYMEMKQFNYMLEINILTNSSQRYLGVMSRDGDRKPGTGSNRPEHCG